eukprot:scaffold543_cov118-Isochrysis_galbana.AAC.3
MCVRADYTPSVVPNHRWHVAGSGVVGDYDNSTPRLSGKGTARRRRRGGLPARRDCGAAERLGQLPAAAALRWRWRGEIAANAARRR